ncbi:DNA-directed RNA polymerase subunit beta [Bienertia sinuspersici]
MNYDIKCEDELVEIGSMGGVEVWNENIDSYHISLIEQERTVKQKLKEKTKKEYNQEQLKNKYNQLRQRWKEFSVLLEETGIGYISKHKFAKAFRKKGSIGSSSHPSTISPSDSENENDTDGDEEGPKTKKLKSYVSHKKLRERVNTVMDDALVAMSENSKKKLELFERRFYGNDEGGNQSKEDHDLLMGCINTSNALEGIDEG